jgi:hypothetical protein
VENRRNFDMQADTSARSVTVYRTANTSSISGRRTEGFAVAAAAAQAAQCPAESQAEF